MSIYLLMFLVIAPFAALLGYYLGLKKDVKESSSSIPSRYLVGIPGKRLAYKGDSRVLAWGFWLVLVQRGGEAYDRHALMTTPKAWIMPKNVSLQYFSPE